MGRRNSTERMDKTISICVTSFNRDLLTIQSFEKVLNDRRVNDVQILDDASDIGFYKSLQYKVDRINSELSSTKVFLHRNENNLDCYRNKRKVLEYAQKDWVLLLDSDNAVDHSYFDALGDFEKIMYGNEWNKKIIYAPTFARPAFDYTELNHVILLKDNAKSVSECFPCFSAAINTANYFFNRHEFSRIWDKYDTGIDPHTADTMYVNLNWIKEGNAIQFVSDMHYNHLIHDGSHYKNNVKKTGTLAEEILAEFKNLK